MGVLYLSQGQWLKASKQFEEVVTLIPNDPHGFINLGNAYFFQGMFDKAALSYEKSLEQQRDSAALSNIATMWFYHGDFDKAVNYYLQAISVNPNKYILWLNLSDAQSQISSYEKEAKSNYQHSIGLIKEILHVEPDNIEARVLLAWSYSNINQLELAQIELDKSLSLASTDPNITFMQSKTAAQIGQLPVAKELLQMSIEQGFPEIVIASSPFAKNLNI